MSGAAISELRALVLAVQFLTRLPVPAERAYSPQHLAAAVRYYPLVGALIGGLCAAVFLATYHWLSLPVATILALATGLAVTGAFHEDGLADTFDGVGASADRARALEIMRDSRLGTYGTIALIVALGLKFAALASIPPGAVGVALIAGHGLSRLSSVVVMETSPYVRDAGAATPVAQRMGASGWIVVVLTGSALTAGLAWTLSPFAVLPAIAGVIAGHVLMRLWYQRRLRGYTGDTLGAVQQASEIGLHLGVVAWH